MNINVELNFDWVLINDFGKTIDEGEYIIEEITIEVENDDFETIKSKLNEYLFSDEFLSEISPGMEDDFDLKFYIRFYLLNIKINNEEYEANEILEDDYILYFDYENNFNISII